MEHMWYAKGISWIDDCRIPFVNEVGIKISGDKKHLQKWKEKDGREKRNIDEIENTPYINTQGRFPANLLVCDDMLNDGKIDKKGKTKISQVGKGRGVIGNHDGRKTLTQAKEGMMMARTLGDGGSNSRYYDIDKWFENLLESCE